MRWREFGRQDNRQEKPATREDHAETRRVVVVS